MLFKKDKFMNSAFTSETMLKNIPVKKIKTLIAELFLYLSLVKIRIVAITPKIIIYNCFIDLLNNSLVLLTEDSLVHLKIGKV